MDAIAIDLRDLRRLIAGERKQRNASAVLLERDRQCGQSSARRLGRDLEGSALADEAIGLVDRHARRRAASGNEVDSSADEYSDTDESGDPPKHGPV